MSTEKISKQPSKKNPMTLEDLARTVVGGFDGMNQKFEGIDQKFDGVYKKFEDADQKFDGIYKKFEGIDRTFGGVDRKFDGVYKRFDGIDQKFDGIDRKIENLALATANEFEVLRSEMATKVELWEVAHEIMQAIELVDVHLSATATQWRDDHDEVRDTIKNHEGRLRTLEKRQKLV